MATQPTFGQRLRERREAKGLSRDYLAARIGVSKAAIQQWEGDATAIQLRHLHQLARELGVSVSTLANWSKDSPLLSDVTRPLRQLCADLRGCLVSPRWEYASGA